MIEVPLGVVYGEKVVVPPGNGKQNGEVDTGFEESSNPRIKFLQSHNNPKKYAFFADKTDLSDWSFKPGYEAEKRLLDYTSSSNGMHLFGDLFLSDTDDIYCKEIIQLPINENERVKFFSTPDKNYKQMTFYNSRELNMGKYIDSVMHPPTDERTYKFENGESDNEEKLFYIDDSVKGGRRKRKTKAKKSKKRRTNKRSKSRS